MTRKVEHIQFLEYSVKMYPKIRQNWLQHHEKYHNIRRYKINPIQLRHPYTCKGIIYTIVLYKTFGDSKE